MSVQGAQLSDDCWFGACVLLILLWIATGVTFYWYGHAQGMIDEVIREEQKTAALGLH